MSSPLRPSSKRLLSLAVLGLSMLGCGQQPAASSIQEQIDSLNAVDRLGVPIDFVYDPDVFPSEARSATQVWSGNWWPLSQGGTTVAMGKYDRAVGQGQAAQRWEQATVDRNGQVSWAGHCNGLAAAGMNEAPPQRGVQYRGQSFTVSDVQALLVEKWQGVSQVALVGRRCSGDTASDANGRLTNPACRDINPASFHVVLGNILGMRQEPFIVDISMGDEVWNYPVVAYSNKVFGLERAEAARLVAEGSNGNYSWNPNAELFMRVEMRLQLANGSAMDLEYVLEGRDGQIIGGEWIGRSKTVHPDFVWTTSRPDPVNPYLDSSVIDTIAGMSR